MAANPPGQGSHDVAAADVLLRTIWFLSLKAFIQVQLLDDLLFRYTERIYTVLWYFFSLSAFPNKARVAILAELEKERKRLIQNPSTGR